MRPFEPVWLKHLPTNTELNFAGRLDLPDLLAPLDRLAKMAQME
jgi:hypothetical protein